MSSLNSSCIAKNRHALYLLLEGDVPLVEGKFSGVDGVVVEDRVDLHALGCRRGECDGQQQQNKEKGRHGRSTRTL